MYLKTILKFPVSIHLHLYGRLPPFRLYVITEERRDSVFRVKESTTLGLSSASQSENQISNYLHFRRVTLHSPSSKLNTWTDRSPTAITACHCQWVSKMARFWAGSNIPSSQRISPLIKCNTYLLHSSTLNFLGLLKLCAGSPRG